MDECCADLAFWFNFSASDVYELDLEDLEIWLEQANRQIRAKWSRGGI